MNADETITVTMTRRQAATVGVALRAFHSVIDHVHAATGLDPEQRNQAITDLLTVQYAIDEAVTADA